MLIDVLSSVIYNLKVIKKHKLFGIIAIALILFNAINLFAFPQSAQAAAEKTPIEIATAYQISKALANCSRDAGWDTPQTKEELNKGALFNRSTDLTDWWGDPKEVGYLVDRTGDGIIKCDDDSDIKGLFELLDTTPFKFLTDNELYKLNSDKTAYVRTSGGDSAAAKTLEEAIKKKYGISDNGLTKAQKYITAKTAFDKKCKKNEDPGGVKVWYIDSNGNGTDKQRSFVVSDESVIVGYGMPGSDQKADCKEIASWMNDNYIAYSDKMKELAAKGIDTNPSGTTDGNTSSNSNTTCESSGLNLSWIICPVYNGIAEVTEWFYYQILGPFLYSPPVSTDPSSNSFKAWSSFRLYGNVFIIIALLVVVFGQSIGGGMIDAYTAKKIVPRIVVAAILINISIYIVAFMVDLSNIAGRGISQILLAPFGELTFSPNAGAQGGALGLAVLGSIAGAGGLVGFVGALLSGGAAPIIIMVMFTIVIPAAIALIGVFATLIIRRGILLALILLSPVAFALYCLPNTEKYFKKWWELLFKTLLVYPIIMLIFAISNILSLTIVQNNEGAITSGIAGIVALACQIIPLFMVPFAFKIAGGLMGSLYAAVENGGKKAGGLLKTRQDQSKLRARNQMLQSRERAYDALGRRGDATTGAGRSAYRFLQSRVGGNDLYAATSAMTAERFKEMEAIKATGRDDELRALNVNKAWALANDAGGGTHWRTTADGGREFRTLGGKWVSENAVDNAHTRWGGDMAAMQWSLGYEMSKAATQEEQDYLHSSFGRLADAGSGLQLSDAQVGGMWTGAAFSAQNTDRQWKHSTWNGDNQELRLSPVQMMREIDERQGNYQMTQQNADTWTTMSEEVNRARRIVSGDPTLSAEERGTMSLEDAQETLQRGARIARSIGQTIPERDPVTGAPTGRYTTSVGQGASGRTKEEMEAYYALFDDGHGGTLDYTREYGVERRQGAAEVITGAGGPRSGQAPLRGSSPTSAGGGGQDAARNDHAVDPDIDNQRNPPRGT